MSGDNATYPCISSCLFPFFIAEVDKGGGGLENSNCEKGFGSLSEYDLIESQMKHLPSPPILASLEVNTLNCDHLAVEKVILNGNWWIVTGCNLGRNTLSYLQI